MKRFIYCYYGLYIRALGVPFPKRVSLRLVCFSYWRSKKHVEVQR